MKEILIKKIVFKTALATLFLWGFSGVSFAQVADTIPPSTPTGLTTTSVTSTQAALSWTASTDNVGIAGYKIWKDGAILAVTTGTGTTYLAPSLTPSTTYSFEVSAYDAAGNNTPKSTALSVTTSAGGGGGGGSGDTIPPTQPTNLKATAISSTQVSLSWTASTDTGGVATYIVYRDGASVAGVASPAVSFINSGISPSTTYSYTIRAVDVAGNPSALSTASSATTPAGSAGGGSGTISKSTAPMITGLTLTQDNSGATFKWTTDVPSTSKIYYGTTATTTSLSVSSNTMTTDHSLLLTGLTSQTKYYFKVESVNSLGEAGTGTLSSSLVSRVAVLSDPTISDYTNIIQRSNNDGLALRVNWSDIEPSYRSFSWSTVDANIALVKANGKQLTLHVLGPVFGVLPTWLTTKGVQFYSHTNPSTNLAKSDPIPWDATFLDEYGAMIKDFGTHMSTRSDKDAFTAISIAAPAPEMGLVACRNVGGVYYIDYPTNSIVYDRAKYLGAWKQMIDVYHNSFPNTVKLLPTPTGFICLGDNDEQFYRDVLDYARTIEPNGFSPFATDLKADGSVRMSKYLSYVTQVPFAYQTTWSATSDATFKMGTLGEGPNLQASVLHGLNNGGNYFEIYLSDLLSSVSDLQNAISLGRVSNFVFSGKTNEIDSIEKTVGGVPANDLTKSQKTETLSKKGISVIFTKDLAFGKSDKEVMFLQALLSEDPTLYPSGAVTGYFDTATKEAVGKFQTRQKLGDAKTVGYGGIGEKTREALNLLAKDFKFTLKQVKPKTRSLMVEALQKTLAAHKEIYPEGLATGYYGPLTENAVKRFQKANGIINYGTPATTGYGKAGPKTIKKINELYEIVI
ncbi:MAG: fibronectin type III domain-containing protein [bacterium]|nr:fibronectin type III domain-containing protein [bacterium]